MQKNMAQKILFHFSLSLLLFFFSMGETLEAQRREADLWNLFINEVTVRYRYSFRHKGYTPRPRFHDPLREMDGQTIQISGYFLPLDVTGNHFVISYFPMDQCFFCGSAGIETIIEVEPIEIETRRFNRLQTDNYIEVRGTLALNDDDDTRLFYILKDAVLIRIRR